MKHQSTDKDVKTNLSLSFFVSKSHEAVSDRNPRSQILHRKLFKNKNEYFSPAVNCFQRNAHILSCETTAELLEFSESSVR